MALTSRPRAAAKDWWQSSRSEARSNVRAPVTVSRDGNRRDLVVVAQFSLRSSCASATDLGGCAVTYVGSK
jgi:hypothetical protein